MKYMVAIETTQYVEVEAENEEAAIEDVKSKMDARIAAAAGFSIVKETVFNEENQNYEIEIKE